jgi:hypothetical protein
MSEAAFSRKAQNREFRAARLARVASTSRPTFASTENSTVSRAFVSTQ